MNRKISNICSALLFAVLIAVAASGQNITSTIVGQVSDPSGGGVPGARITVTNAGTGISTEAAASSSGAYSVPGLLAGTYTVAVESHGFATSKQTGIVLQSAQTVRVDIPLKVGATSETVLVSGAAPLIHLDTSSLEGTANTHQIRDLPAAYQTVISLFALVPGANAGQGSSNPQIAGSTHWGSTNFTLNGVSVNDQHNGGAAYSSGSGGLNLINLPGLDSMQEFRVTAVSANAEFRDVASVTMVTKQGTNQFHGDLYEFFQNRVLNANTFLLNASGAPRPQNNLNQFGGSIGGPIFKNKTFFFFAPAYLRQITPGLADLTLPSTAMTKGDFGALGTQLYNPLTGQPFVNDQIPSSMIASQAQSLLKYLPAPTVAGSTGLPNGTPNYIANVPIPVSMSSYTARVDEQLTSSDSLFGVYSHNTGLPWRQSLGGPPQYGNASNYGYRDQTASATETHVFNPTMLNDFRAAWFVHTSFRYGDNQDFNPASLFPQLTPGANRGLPTMSPTGYSKLFNDVGNTTHGSFYDVEFTDNFTKVLGAHTLKIGFDETGYKEYDRSNWGPLGSFVFTGVWTGNKGWPNRPQSQGNAFADFLLGYGNSASTGTIGPNSVEYNRDYEAYVQDSWQASPRLTLYYGIRYMYQTPWKVRNNARSLYDLANNKIALPQDSPTPTLPVLGNAALFKAFLPYFETTQSIGLPSQYMRPSTKYWAPRVGFAYRPISNTVIRGGFGVYYNFLIEALAGRDTGNIPFGSITETATSLLPGKPTSTYLPDLTFQDPFGNATGNIPLNPALSYVQPDLKNAAVQQWNLTVERQFRQNWMARASYVGSETHHISWLSSDINQPIVQIPNEALQAQRPQQPWGAINSVRSGGNQSFNQLQLEAIRRYVNGMSFQAEYAWTRSLDDVENSGNPSRWFYPDYDYGNSTGIRTQSLVFNYLYELPFGRGKTWLNNSSSVVNALAGGWQVTGITTYATGAPFSVSFSVPSNYIGWLGGRAQTVPGVPVYQRGSGHGVVSGVQWFNPAAFGPPQPWTWGNTGRNILWGPGMWNWDMSALKQIPVVSERVRMTLRADFLDAFNHFNLSNPTATVASTQYGGVPAPSAGKIFSGSGNRTIQLGLRLSF